MGMLHCLLSIIDEISRVAAIVWFVPWMVETVQKAILVVRLIRGLD